MNMNAIRWRLVIQTSLMGAILVALVGELESAAGQETRDSVPAAVKAAKKIAHQGPFQPTWESLQRYKIPVWYQDAKFGIFIHWGVYSVPAYLSEWYPRWMYIDQHIRFTTKGTVLYAIALGWPDDGRLTITSLRSGSPLLMKEPTDVTVLGSNASVTWQRNEKGLVVDLPQDPPCQHAFVIAIQTR